MGICFDECEGAGGYQKQLVPTNKDGKEMPVRLWDAFKTPNTEPWIWGIFCEQFSWFGECVLCAPSLASCLEIMLGSQKTASWLL
jgi:hypothetical protein